MPASVRARPFALCSCVLVGVVACGDAGGGADGDAGSEGVDAASAEGGSGSGSDGGGDASSEATADASGPGEGSSDGGAGEVPGMPCDEPFTAYGLEGCVSEVGGYSVKFFPPADTTPAAHLAVYFHGDTAADWDDGWPFPAMVQWANAHDTVVIAPKATTDYGDGLPAWGAAQAPDAEAVAATILAFIDGYGAPPESLLVWSTSGGSWFLSSSFIEIAGGQMQGAFAMSCGGSQFWNPYAWDATAAQPRGRFALLWNYGSLDFLAEYAQMTHDKFEADGFAVDMLVHDGAMHCQHPIDEPTLAFWEAALGL